MALAITYQFEKKFGEKKGAGGRGGGNVNRYQSSSLSSKGNLGLQRTAEIQPPVGVWVVEHWPLCWGTAQPEQLYHDFLYLHLHWATQRWRGRRQLPVSWLWVRALPSVRRWGASDAPARACSQFSEYDFRDLPTGAGGQVLLSWHPITCSLSHPSFESPLTPPSGEALGMSGPTWADWKGRATTDLSPVSSFSSSLPKSTLPLVQSPSWRHNSRYRRCPLLQDLPKYPQKHHRCPKDRNTPLYRRTTPPLPSNQRPVLTSQRSKSSSEGKGQTQGCQTSHHLCIPRRES